MAGAAGGAGAGGAAAEARETLRAYFTAKIGGDRSLLPKDGESLALLNEQSYTFTKDDLLIADDARPLALAGVMGGMPSGVSAATTAIFLESACFSPETVAATGQTAVFLLNRHLTDEMELSITLRGLGTDRQLVQAEQLYSADLNATNSADAPDRVAPQALDGISMEGEQLRVKLKPASWNVIVTKAARA